MSAQTNPSEILPARYKIDARKIQFDCHPAIAYTVDMLPTLPQLEDSPLVLASLQFVTILNIYTSVVRFPSDAKLRRYFGVAVLFFVTYKLQGTLVQLCANRHWRGAATSLLWIQLLSASEIICVSRVHIREILADAGGSTDDAADTVLSPAPVALLWNLRRVGTKWQVPRLILPSNGREGRSSRAYFILGRLAATFLAFFILDVLVSAPPPDVALVGRQKQALLKLDGISVEDIIFRVLGTFSFWLSTALINLVMANSASLPPLILGLTSPSQCPPIYGDFRDAYSVRRFWG